MRHDQARSSQKLPAAPAKRPRPELVTFTVSLEARVMQGLSDVFGMYEDAPRPLPPEVLRELRVAVSGLVQCASRGERMDAGTLTNPSEFAAQHSQPVKVAELAILMAQATGMPAAGLSEIGMAAELMNLGYALLRARIVDEPRLLDDRVWQEEIKQHPLLSAEIVAQSGLGETVIATIEQHHERCDGSGYPRGMSGDEIVLPARILAVADAFVSLCIGSSNRRALQPGSALKTMQARAGTMFDREAVRLLVQVLAEDEKPDAWVLNPDERDRVVRALRRMSSDRPLPFSRAPRRARAATPPASVRSPNALAPEMLQPDMLVPASLASQPVRAPGDPQGVPSRRPQPLSATSLYPRRPLARRRRRRRSLWSKEYYLASRSAGGGWFSAVAAHRSPHATNA